MEERRGRSRSTGTTRNNKSYSAFIPASFTTFAQRSRSFAMKLVSSLPVVTRTSAPCAASFSLISGVARIFCTSLASFDTICGGVPGRREDALPRSGLESRIAALGDRRHVRDGRQPIRTRHREDAQLPAFHLRIRREHAVEQQVRLSADDVGDRLRAALVRDVGPVDLRALRELDAGEVRRTAGRRRRVIELARLRLGERHELGHVLRRHARIHREDVRRVRDHRDRREVLHRIERQREVHTAG